MSYSRHIKIVICFLVSVGWLCTYTAPALAASDDSIHWVSYSSGVFSQAAKTKKWVMIYGYAPWCHYCQKMQATTWSDSQVAKIVGEHFIPVKLNVDDEVNLARKFQINNYPTVVIINSKQEIVKTIIGYTPPSSFIAKIEEVIN